MMMCSALRSDPPGLQGSESENSILVCLLIMQDTRDEQDVDLLSCAGTSVSSGRQQGDWEIKMLYDGGVLLHI